jgi:hypothetical protein
LCEGNEPVRPRPDGRLATGWGALLRREPQGRTLPVEVRGMVEVEGRPLASDETALVTVRRTGAPWRPVTSG